MSDVEAHVVLHHIQLEQNSNRYFAY
jgi:hypothetical protein